MQKVSLHKGLQCLTFQRSQRATPSAVASGGKRRSLRSRPAYAQIAVNIVTVLLFCAHLSAADASMSLKETQLIELLSVKAVYVDPLNGPASDQIRDLLISSLHRAGLFMIVEDEERADAFLRGSAEDLMYSDYYTTRGGFNVRGSSSESHRESGESDFVSGSIGLGENDGFSSRRRKHEAMAAVRLVLRNGDVIWSTTQESSGAKYKGAGADVADKVAKDLVTAYHWAQKVEKKVNAKPALQPPISSPQE